MLHSTRRCLINSRYKASCLKNTGLRAAKRRALTRRSVSRTLSRKVPVRLPAHPLRGASALPRRRLKSYFYKLVVAPKRRRPVFHTFFKVTPPLTLRRNRFVRAYTAVKLFRGRTHTRRVLTKKVGRLARKLLARRRYKLPASSDLVDPLAGPKLFLPTRYDYDLRGSVFPSRKARHLLRNKELFQ